MSNSTDNPCSSPQTKVARAAERDISDATLDPPIRARGKLNRDEIEHSLSLKDGHRVEPAKIWKWLGFAVLVVMAASALALVVEQPTWPGGYIGFVLLVAWLYLAAIHTPRMHRRFVDRLEQAAEEVEYVLATDGLEMRAAGDAVQIAWSDIKGFRDSDRLVLLCWEGNEFAISRRWFGADEDFSRFVIFLGHRVEMLS